MSEIKIDYAAVYSRTAELRNHINSDLLTRIENEYSQIQSELDGVDGAASAELKREMDENKKKEITVLQTLDRLLMFMICSAKEFELSDKTMSAEVLSGAKDMQGGTK